MPGLSQTRSSTLTAPPRIPPSSAVVGMRPSSVGVLFLYLLVGLGPRDEAIGVVRDEKRSSLKTRSLSLVTANDGTLFCFVPEGALEPTSVSRPVRGSSEPARCVGESDRAGRPPGVSGADCGRGRYLSNVNRAPFWLAVVVPLAHHDEPPNRSLELTPTFITGYDDAVFTAVSASDLLPAEEAAHEKRRNLVCSRRHGIS